MNTRRYYVLSIMLTGLMLLPVVPGCGGGGGDGNGGGHDHSEARPGGVVVTIFPLYDLIRQIAEPEIDVSLLLPADLSPHTYQPTPADILTISEARLLITNGGGLDAWIDDFAQREKAKGLEVMTLCARLGGATAAARGEDEDEHDGHGHDDHGHGAGLNPHQWLVPEVAARFVGQVGVELRHLYPEYEKEIRAREMNLIGDLAALIVEYEDALEPLTDRRMITFHDSFNPLAEAFGLEVVATLYTFESMDVTPAAIQEAVRQINELNVRAVFIEPQINPAAAKRLGELVPLRTLDPLGSPNRAGVRTYQELMRTNLQALVEGLSANSADNEAGASDTAPSSEDHSHGDHGGG